VAVGCGVRGEIDAEVEAHEGGEDFDHGGLVAVVAGVDGELL